MIGIDSLGIGAWLGVVAAIAMGAAYLGWRVRQLREEQRRRDHDASVREEIKAARCARDRAKAERQEAEERFQRLKGEHSGCEARIGRLEDAFASREADLAAVAEELRGRDDRLSQLEAMAESERAELVSLTEQLAVLKKLRAELVSARKAHAGCADREKALRERVAAIQAKLEVSERLREEAAPRWLMSGPQGHKDDLKAIRGLGPVLERDLNKLGIFHFHQLARMTARDADWIAGRITAFPGLNKRYGWADQARMMKGRVVTRQGGNGGRSADRVREH